MKPDKEHIRRAARKARTSICRYQVVAIGFRHEGGTVVKVNSPRFGRKGGGLHAEEKLLRQYKDKLSSIYVFRLGRVGWIDPCEKCLALAAKYGVDIIAIEGAK